jgi:UDP-N-acetylmuramoylalanine-D-glutamate ligase
VVLLESDERYARHTFKHIKPTIFAITNLYRDQLTRNAHPYHIYDIIKDAVELAPRAKLVLNADDPIVRNFGYQRENVVYFGMDKNGFSTENTDALYNDCHYCPGAKAKCTTISSTTPIWVPITAPPAATQDRKLNSPSVPWICSPAQSTSTAM